MPELAERSALHVAVDLMRDRATERNQPITKKLAERVVAVFGQAGANKTKGDRGRLAGCLRCTRAVSQVLYTLAASSGNLSQGSGYFRQVQRRVGQVAESFDW